MAALLADENFPLGAVEALRRLGHDVLTLTEAGRANRAIPDREVLEFAASSGRALLTLDRWDFVALHALSPSHAGVVVCSNDADPEVLAARIDEALRGANHLHGRLIRVNRLGR